MRLGKWTIQYSIFRFAWRRKDRAAYCHHKEPSFKKRKFFKLCISRAPSGGKRAGLIIHNTNSVPSQAKLTSDTLLLLTRTRTDSRGRRHSISIPLIPPPDGELFEGGYHVERNPITGGARLVAPKQCKKIIYYKALCCS